MINILKSNVMKKKIVFSLMLLFSMFVVKAKSTESVYVYGVDYSSVKVYGAKETTEQFKKAFESINLLLINEAKKYNFSKIVGKNNQLKIEMILKATKEYDFSNIKTLDTDIEPINISEKIKNYPIKESSGNGFIVIATLLDKSSNKATYKVVLFDIETRKILNEKEFTSKAGGFGLKNFWANTIYLLTKTFKFDKKK